MLVSMSRTFPNANKILFLGEVEYDVPENGINVSPVMLDAGTTRYRRYVLSKGSGTSSLVFQK